MALSWDIPGLECQLFLSPSAVFRKLMYVSISLGVKFADKCNLV